MLHWKQCGSWSAGFFRSQLIWIYTVYKRVDIWMVSYCFRKCKLFKNRKVLDNLYYRTSKIFFGQVHYGHLLVPGQVEKGQVENFTISTPLYIFERILSQTYEKDIKWTAARLKISKVIFMLKRPHHVMADLGLHQELRGTFIKLWKCGNKWWTRKKYLCGDGTEKSRPSSQSLASLMMLSGVPQDKLFSPWHSS